MATINVVEARGKYYRVCVEFSGQEFEQPVVSLATGAALDAQLQAYAEDYEVQWLSLNGLEAALT